VAREVSKRFRFRLVDGSGGTAIYMAGATLEQVIAGCVDRFGGHRLLEVYVG